MTRTLAGLLLAIGVALPGASASYLDIVARYRAGAFEEAVKTLASHSNAQSPAYVLRQLERVHPEAAAPHVTLLPMAKRLASFAFAPVLPAAAALHLDTGEYLLRTGDAERGVGHLMAARAIVDGDWWTTVPLNVPDRVALYGEARHATYMAIIFALQPYHQFAALVPHLERAREEFPKDAEIRLALGTLDELRATAIMLRQVESPTRQKQEEYLDKAARHFRDALTLNGDLTEARVRLGRVLQERGRLADARRELEAEAAMPAVNSSGPVHYFASLFLGEVLEAQGDLAGAVTRYRTAVAGWPGCQSAQVALSQALDAMGDRQAAAKALAPLWRTDQERTCDDPWGQYYEGQARRFAPLIVELRRSVKDKS